MKRFILLFLTLFLFGVQAQENKFSYGFDIGANLLLYPHQDFRTHYRDALYKPGLRIATHMTYGKIRLEYGAVYNQYKMDKSPLHHYQGVLVDKLSTKINILQHETLFLFVKNDPDRVSFIGFGFISLDGDETVSFSSPTLQQKTISNKTSGTGYKLTVGGNDKGSLLKVTFSYTTARIKSILGNSYDAGGYAFTFHLTFDTI